MHLSPKASTFTLQPLRSATINPICSFCSKQIHSSITMSSISGTHFLRHSMPMSLNPASAKPHVKAFNVRAATAAAASVDPVSLGVMARNKTGPTLYEVLRVKTTASQTEIKTAYRSLAKLYHPDSASPLESDSGRDFIEIHEAYATLSDPASRARYDLSISLMAECLFGYSTSRSGSELRFNRRWETDQCW